MFKLFFYRKLWVLSFLLISLFSKNLVAQSNHILFKHLSLSQGLSQSPIFSLFQDKAGFIWIGSRDGLMRYDGYEFKHFKNEGLDNRSINHSDISAIKQDENGNLWIASSNGLCWFDMQKETINYVPLKGFNAVFDLILANDATHLFLATDNGVFTFNYRNFTLEGKGRLLRAIRVNRLYRDKDGIIWAGTKKNGVFRTDIKKDRIYPLPEAIKNNNDIAGADVMAIKQDKDGEFWFGTGNSGIYRYNPKSNECVNYKNSSEANSLLSDFVKAIYERGNGDIWIGTRNGLSIYNKLSKKFTNYSHQSDNPSSLSYNTIWAIMEDQSKSVWISTYAGGINIYTPSNANFTHIGEQKLKIPGLNHPVVNAILGYKNSGVWVGTDGGGLNFIDRQTGDIKYYSVKDRQLRNNSNIIKTLCYDAAGNLWIGTHDGLCKFDYASHEVKYFNISSGTFLSDIRINTILADDNGIWIGTDERGLRYLHKDGSVKEYYAGKEKNALTSNHINVLVKDLNGGFWIGTANGLNFFDFNTKTFTHFLTPSSQNLTSNVVLSLFQDARGWIWVGTRSGLKILDKSKKALVGAEIKGLKNEVIKAITQDAEGNIWVSTAQGISKITLDKKQASINQPQYSTQNYTYEDGLLSNQFMLNSVDVNAAGEVMFGGVNGITSFVPKNIVKNTYKPKVVITDFFIQNRLISLQTPNTPLEVAIDQTKSLTLNYDQASIGFKFAALNYVNSENNIYSYKLEGLDKDWNNVAQQRMANYTNLAPGNYVLKIKAANNDGIWGAETTQLKIKILPPLWRTWWAYLIYVLAGTFTFIVIIRFFKRQARLERDLFHEHTEYQRQQQLHQMKLDFFTNISHEIRTPLTLIFGPVEKLLAETKDNPKINKQILYIRNNTSRLLRLINELLDFRKTDTGNMKLHVQSSDLVEFLGEVFSMFDALALEKGITFQFVHQNQEIPLYFDKDQLEKVFLNLLSNAFKSTSDSGAITLSITDGVDDVTISVKDNGKGIPLESQEKIFSNFYQVESHINAGTGIGLSLSKAIVELHHGKISVSSMPANDGKLGATEFKVTLLKGFKHFSAEQLNAIPKLLEVDGRPLPVSIGQLELENSLPEAFNEAGKSKYKVLVVEDNAEVRAFIADNLAEDYEVLESENGKTGLEVATTIVPDLIISDVMMPEMDGTELCAKLKADERTSHIPVVLLTAKSAYEHQLEGLKMGADSYVTKPFGVELLKLKVGNLIKARNAMRLKFSKQIVLEPQELVIESADEKFLYKAISIIEKSMENPDFGVAVLAAEIGMSQPVLYRKIKALTDLSVADFIKSIKLKKAAMLLANTDMSVAEIAFTVGFSDRRHFSKEFIKMFGRRPTEYAESLKQ